MPVAWRRAIVLALNLSTIMALAFALYHVLAPDGIDELEAAMLAGFVLATPWTVLGFWNAMIGLLLLQGPASPQRSVHPFFGAEPAPRVTRLYSRTALTVFLRNEDPEPIFQRMEALRASIQRTGLSRHFHFVFLSDTSDPRIAALEDAGFAVFAADDASDGAPAPLLRRRQENTGFKAGNLRDFLLEHGGRYDFFLPLDSDSLMAGDMVVCMASAMEQAPKVGILQSLVVGMPATSAFARVFQFGMRHGMRSFTMGAAWWTADCGSYWGHNALIRTAPFVEHCGLPVLPGRPPLGGSILSHDQVEAAFMRRAGFEVRVIPLETQSFETNPPTLPDFIQRDLRWCQGNMQYWRLLAEPGLAPLSRFQLLQAILMYLAPPAWLAMTGAALAKGMAGGIHPESISLGLVLFAAIFLLSIAPKLAGVLDVAMRPGAVKLYGGALRFTLSAILELVVSMAMAPIVAVSISIFLVGLCFGRRIFWDGQNRDRLGIDGRLAVKLMWPQTLIGFAMVFLAFQAGPAASIWILPMAAGLCGAIPFTVATASPTLGRWVTRLGLFAIPEETALPRVLREIVPEAARRWRRTGRPAAKAMPSASRSVETETADIHG